MLSAKCIALQALLLLLVSQQASSLEPRIQDGSKNLLPNEIRQEHKYNSAKSKYEQKSNVSSASDEPVKANSNPKNDDDGDEDDHDDNEDHKRIVISEPYKSLMQHSMRFALAQSSLMNYLQIDTVMDLMNDTGYMLASPYMLKKALRLATIIGATVMTLILFVPRVYWKQLTTGWVHSRGRLLEIEKYLPNGLNEMGIVSLLEQKTEEMLARFELNQSACRQQAVCQAGELLRCAFPKGSKSVVNFISENFSRPRYRDHEYIGSFLKGFVDLNCAANTEMDQSRTCLSGYIKSVSSCVKPSNPLQVQPTPVQQASAPKYEFLQTLQAARA